jgi:arylsulfatase A-like enzyme
VVVFTSDHGFYFGEHGYFGKAEWIHDPGAVLTEGSVVPEWFSRSWLLTIGWSPLYQELTRVPLMVRAPTVAPGRRRALTTAPDIPATILDIAGVEAPPEVQGSSFRDVIAGTAAEHRALVVSSWPLYFAEGELTSAIDSRPRRIASYMPITTTTRTRSLIIGGRDEPPELYDLEHDPGESTNIWAESSDEGRRLFEQALEFLEAMGAQERYLEPRRESLATHRPSLGL